MDIVLLEYLLRLFALITNLYPSLHFNNVRDFVKSFLLKELSPEIENESLRLFNGYYQMFAYVKQNPENPENSQILIQTIEQIDRNIPRIQKFNILLRLILFQKFLLRYPSISQKNQMDFTDILNLIIGNFLISEREFLNCKNFIGESYYKIPDKNRLMVVSNSSVYNLGIKFMSRENLQGQMFFLYVESINSLLFTYKGKASLSINNQPLFSNHIYFLHKGFSIKGHGFEPVYYNQVMQGFLSDNNANFNFVAHNVEYHYVNSKNGIQLTNLHFKSGQLVGIIGRSGVGKSTLINLLIGKIQPQKGKVTINNRNIYAENNELDGLIGYIPQDDLLIEELSVFSNLYLNSQLCFDSVSKEALTEKVNNLLTELDLFEVRNLRVGTPLNKFISGGQRKKLNIALELIRQPWVLFADEPTSGLSSSDSEEIMQLLAEQTIKGRIVVVNIHQPSSDIFKLFDKIIVLDKEGHMVYFGNPLDSIPYFNDFYQRISIAADSCNVCENINPEAIFKILEEKKINDLGEFTKERKTTPAQWHKNFLENAPQLPPPAKTTPLPKIEFKKPGALKQLIIFSKRNLLSKLANTQYVLLALLISPLLAVVLSLLCRYTSITENSAFKYTFSANDNIPSYLFMSVIVALFVGLIISAEEIIRDRRILFREEFLKLSRLSYINSKVLYLFALSALQTILFVLIGNAILDIQSMTLYFWLILFSLACFSNLFGLFISSLFNSVVTIYIMVPLIIVPQILLSGVVVNYKKLNNLVSSNEYVPVVGDFMASRWAYEALIVTQFTKNEYQKQFYEIEKLESNAKFVLMFTIPEIKKSLFELGSLNKSSIEYQNHLYFVRNELAVLKQSDYAYRFNNIDLNPLNLREIEKRITILNKEIPKQMSALSVKKDSVTHQLIANMGSTENFLYFKSLNYNNELSDMVLKRKELSSYTRYKNRIIREMEPIYQNPISRTGRAHFLASQKNIGNTTISTFAFNLMVIWAMTFIFYGILIIFSIFNHKPGRLKSFLKLKFRFKSTVL